MRQQALGNSKAKIFAFALCAMLLALGFAAQAQQPKKVHRMGFVSGTPGPDVKGFQKGLQELGYIEGKNILVEYRYYEGVTERSRSLVAELVQLKVDVLVVSQLAAIQAAKQATKTIPLVMVTTADPVASGLIDSLARPGGNLTGLTLLTRELNGKRLQLLKEMIPTLSRVGVLMPDSAAAGIRFKEYDAEARAVNLPIQSLKIKTQNPDFDSLFQTAAKAHVSALIILRSGLLIGNRKQIADLAIKNRLPSMSELSDMVEVGALASYSTNEGESFRRAAVFIDKILKGTKPADLPVEQPTKFEFVINLKTAKQIDLTIPPNVLARADRVIR
jgi:putative ABC transport system substrate-binding protein